MKASALARADARLARYLVMPAIVIISLVAIVPIGATAWEALHQHDLRFPWLGRPFVGLSNFVEAFSDPRFIDAVLHVVMFAVVSVPIELALGLVLALLMHHVTRGRAAIRVVALIPWAVPTVVAALVWRFMFDAQAGVVNLLVGAQNFDWFVDPLVAWVPIIVADVWKTTPFVAILLLAGLQAIDPALDDAARIDGARSLRRLVTITLPLLRPALIVAAAFRVLDALRLFDLPYVLSGGGPGTATEPLSLYAYTALMQRLRFGYGSALSVMVFVLAFVVAMLFVRALGRSAPGERA